MSAFYIIGSSELLSCEINGIILQKVDVLNMGFPNDTLPYFAEQNYYYLPYVDALGYNITNIKDFDSDYKKQNFFMFLKFIKSIIKISGQVAFYNFFDGNTLDSEENQIYFVKQLTTNPQDYADDYFAFELNTKYVFKS